MTPMFQVWMDDVPFPEPGNTERGLGLGGLRACLSLVCGRWSLSYFGVPLRYVIWGSIQKGVG